MSLRGFDFKNLSVDRSCFTTVYKELVKAVDGGINKEIDLYNLSVENQNFVQVAFAVSVFLELEFIIKQNGVYVVNKGAKNSLENSLIYQNIKKLQ